VLFLSLFLFFFSSRRRHTRCYRDWSSDVCSSDLFLPERGRRVRERDGSLRAFDRERKDRVSVRFDFRNRDEKPAFERVREELRQIGRASCRERVWVAVWEVEGSKEREGRQT